MIKHIQSLNDRWSSGWLLALVIALTFAGEQARADSPTPQGRKSGVLFAMSKVVSSPSTWMRSKGRTVSKKRPSPSVVSAPARSEPAEPNEVHLEAPRHVLEQESMSSQPAAIEPTRPSSISEARSSRRSAILRERKTTQVTIEASVADAHWKATSTSSPVFKP